MKSRQQKQGSGLDERGVAVVINPRIKRRGMRCKRVNAIAVVALGVRLLKAAWEKDQPTLDRCLSPDVWWNRSLLEKAIKEWRKQPSSYLHFMPVSCIAPLTGGISRQRPPTGHPRTVAADCCAVPDPWYGGRCPGHGDTLS